MRPEYDSVFDFDRDYFVENPGIDEFVRYAEIGDIPLGVKPPSNMLVRVRRLGPGIRSREFIYQ